MSGNSQNMDNSEVKNVLRHFWGKEVSSKTFFLFVRWFRLNKEHADVDDAMYGIWQETSSVADARTQSDLKRIKKQIEDVPRAKNVFLKLLPYAAVLVLFVATAVFITYRLALLSRLEYTQLSVPYGKSEKVTLSDGTVVTVNAGSTLIYPEKFKGSTRTVLGTKFIVQAYSDNRYTNTTLIEGSIRVNITTGNKESFVLKPNSQLVYSHNKGEVSVVDVDAVQLASWENGYLIFQGVGFEEIAHAIELKYNVEFDYDSYLLDEQSYYVKFTPDESLEDVLNVLTMLIDRSHYKLENDRVCFFLQVFLQIKSRHLCPLGVLPSGCAYIRTFLLSVYLPHVRIALALKSLLTEPGCAAIVRKKSGIT